MGVGSSSSISRAARDRERGAVGELDGRVAGRRLDHVRSGEHGLDRDGSIGTFFGDPASMHGGMIATRAGSMPSHT